MTIENSHDKAWVTKANASSNPSASRTAALRGAALAFGNPPVKPKPNVKINAFRNHSGALTAATIANNTTGTKAEDERRPPQRTGGGIEYGSMGGGSDSGVVQQTSRQFSKPDALGHLKVPGESADRSTSPSFIAAALAASRSPLSPNHTGQATKSPSPQQRRTSPGMRSPSSIRDISRPKVVPDDALDTASIPPTTSLIGMFEKSGGAKPFAQKATSGFAVARAPPPEIKSPKPIRAQPVSLKSDSIPPPKGAPPTHWSVSLPSSPVNQSSPNARAHSDDEKAASSDDSFVSASETRPNSILPAARKQRPRRPPSISPSTNSMTIDSLANAIVASSLASSRTASPNKSGLTAPPLPSPRRSKNALFHHHDTRTPSPAKGFRQTMRKPKKEEEEEDHNMLRMGKKNLMKKHPNKHHEGDRKRWRDSITERERKRYEAVWASNRGLYLRNGPTTSYPPPPRVSVPPQTSNSDPERIFESVSNLVVRDIWSRSRLGDDILGEVWELVDRNGAGKLSREEFVTGLWLIDQRLKGRKLPIRVSPSVWASAGALVGVKVKGNGRKQQR